MTDHIYGRGNIIGDAQRPHMFINELRLYLQYLAEQPAPADAKAEKQHRLFCENLQQGITYYRELHTAGIIRDERFAPMLEEAEAALLAMA